ncbi:NADAR family protein [Blastopirellula marina]|uniref:DUF1768 domain-containing protein n=1 Tax=Blastopirellula marina TaxID=124 RepID=A0A2S8G9Q0_9BACT|nr:NADAR family protein [Blastopirellula marina]PQO41192.1 DUF1768 domain-containing protein [Blastopirellula marina]PTL46068.1 DUF1768 domain-containing protein [Blastopirellula marina]
MTIEFYSTKHIYGEFSNFAPFAFEIDGLVYPTSEHYFQAMKFPDEQYQERIRETKSPMIAARLGRSRKVKIRDDWEEVKIDIMRTAVRAKFLAHPTLQDLMLETGDETLVEAADGDYFWGAGKDGSGQNWLGKILMEVRDELRESPPENT